MKTKTVNPKLDYSLSNLNWLYIDKASFHTWIEKHQTKIMFRFTLTTNEISLTGWAPKKSDADNEYDQTDLLILQISPEINPLTEDAVYLGNIKLTKKDNLKIDNLLQITPNANYVLFKPVNYADDAKHVAYEVYISSSTSFSDIIFIHLTPTPAAKADPSPPANRK